MIRDENIFANKYNFPSKAIEALSKGVPIYSRYTISGLSQSLYIQLSTLNQSVNSMNKYKEQFLKAKEHNKWMVEKAINLGGTCTGEHGIGQGKSAYLRAEMGGSVDVMADIKATFDPKHILNPGKLFE